MLAVYVKASTGGNRYDYPSPEVYGDTGLTSTIADDDSYTSITSSAPRPTRLFMTAIHGPEFRFLLRATPLAQPVSRRYSSCMEIPLSLRKTADGSLVYGIPLWYRVMTAALIAVMASGVFIAGSAPGLIGWIVLALLLLGFVYDERWIIDPKARVIRHYGGLWPFARAMRVDFDDIEGFSLRAFARGTVPGSESETKEQEKAFAMMNGKDADRGEKVSLFRSMGRKPYINLLVNTESGDTYLVDTLPARRAGRLKKVGEAMAAACGAGFLERG